MYVLCCSSPVRLCNPMDCSPPGSSVRGILQARILEWVAILFSRGSSRPRDQTCISLCFLHWQVDSLLLVPPGKPRGSTFLKIFFKTCILHLTKCNMKVKQESEKVGLKLNIQKTKIMASSPITSWQIDGETVDSG